MSFKTFAAAAAVAFTFAAPAIADSMIMIDDAYARAASKASKSGAAFMAIMNHGDEDDQLVDVRSDVAKKVELHTHMESAGGVMKMMHVPEGFAIAAGETHMLMRGGDHVMMMGLNQTFEHGDVISITLVFEKAGDVSLEVPVDLERTPDHGAMTHSGHNTDN